VNRNRLVSLIIGVLLLALLTSIFYTVDETEQVVITQFGRPIGDAIATPGLKLKLPFIWEIHRFDKRWLAWDGDSNQITTKDKKFIWVDTYARWRIQDPLEFFESVRDEAGAQSRLDDIIDGETRNTVAAFDLIEIVRAAEVQNAGAAGAIFRPPGAPTARYGASSRSARTGSRANLAKAPRPMTPTLSLVTACTPWSPWFPFRPLRVIFHSGSLAGDLADLIRFEMIDVRAIQRP